MTCFIKGWVFNDPQAVSTIPTRFFFEVRVRVWVRVRVRVIKG